MTLLYLSVPVCYDSVTVSQRERHQDAENEEAKWNSAITHFNVYT